MIFGRITVDQDIEDAEIPTDHIYELTGGSCMDL